MKPFKLYFDSSDPCDTLDRAWFGEMWFPVQKSICQIQSVVSQANIPDPADLDMDFGCEEPELCFSKSQVSGQFRGFRLRFGFHPKRAKCTYYLEIPFFGPKNDRKTLKTTEASDSCFSNFFLATLLATFSETEFLPSPWVQVSKKKNWPPSAAFRDFFCKRSPDGPL